MAGTTEERLVDVELKLMHQDRLLETLNEVVIELRGEVTALRKQIERLDEQQRATDEDGAPADDPPPHY